MLKKLFGLTGALAVLLASLCGVSAAAQNRAIHGKVVDDTGAPVVGAAVVVVGNTSLGAVTGIDGTYRLTVPAGANVEFSCIGYGTQVVAVGDKTVIDIVLKEDAEFID